MKVHETVSVVIYTQSGFGDPYRIAVFDSEEDANLFSFRIKRELGVTPTVKSAILNRRQTGD